MSRPTPPPADEAAWDATYGSFADGTARRMELITNANHRLVTINSHAIATAVDWFEQAFTMSAPIVSTDPTALVKESFLFLGTLAALLTTEFALVAMPVLGESIEQRNTRQLAKWARDGLHMIEAASPKRRRSRGHKHHRIGAGQHTA